MRKFYLLLIGCCAVLAGCGMNKIVEIEENNNYQWQKFMSEDEFNELKEGYSYLQVLEIAGGQGELVKEGKYVWPDEILMTQAYEITFESDKLVKKKIVKRWGNSTRYLPEGEK